VLHRQRKGTTKSPVEQTSSFLFLAPPPLRRSKNSRDHSQDLVRGVDDVGKLSECSEDDRLEDSRASDLNRRKGGGGERGREGQLKLDLDMMKADGDKIEFRLTLLKF